MLVAAASGYHGPPVLTPWSAFVSWRVDPGVAAFIVAVGAVYLAGVRRVRASGFSWPRSRVVCFIFLGMGSLLIATMSFVGVYAHTLFWVYALQNVVLLMVIPLFFALGMPLLLALHGLPPGPATRLAGVLDGRLGRVIVFPVTGSIIMIVVPFVVYFSGLYEQSLRHYLIYELVHFLLVVTGFLFFWSVMGGADVARRVPFAAALFIAFVELLFDAVPGIVVRYTTRILGGGYYRQLARPWGPSLRRDQGFGGAVLWFVGEAVGVPVLTVLMARWIAEERRETARVDRALDGAAQLADDETNRRIEVAGGAELAGEGQPTAEDGQEYSQPWWESDPSLFGDRARRYGWKDRNNPDE